MSDHESEINPDSGGSTSQNLQTTRTPNIRPPRTFDVFQTTARTWELWKQMWENYSIVTRLDQQNDQYQKVTFLCTTGEEVLEFSASKNLNKVSTIIQKFDEYFARDVNETYERYKFNQRQQSERESFDTYLIVLKILRKSCNFCICLSNSLLRDRIVFGIRDDHARKRLL